MIYQPSYPQPYQTDIDATLSNNFTCYINAEGGTQVIAYNLNINNLSGTQIYTTSKQTLSTPLYGKETLSVTVPNTSGMLNGTNYVWNVTLYEASPSIFVTSGAVTSVVPVVTGKVTQLYIPASYLVEVGMYMTIGSETRQIITCTTESSSLYIQVATGFSSSVAANAFYTITSDHVKSNDFYFQARTTPVLTLATIPTPITAKSYTFTATYTQAENIGWKYYQWTFYNYRGVAIETSDQITTGAIQYTFDGFFSNTTYGVGLFVENQDGTELSTGVQYFTVSYQSPSLAVTPTVNSVCDQAALQVQWDKLLINAGTAEGTGSTPYYTLVPDQPYTGGSSVQIGQNNDIYWYTGASNALVNVPYDSTTYLYWTTSDTEFTGMIYEQDGVYNNLIAVSQIAPTTCSTGDQYYNIVDNVIYTATATNTWGTTGIVPDSTIMYYVTSTSQGYIYDGTTLVTMTYALPHYKVWYSAYSFYYEIYNGGTTVSGSVSPFEALSYDWLLQPTTTPTDNTIYQWQDTKTWLDGYYWTESNQSIYITNYWYKITLLPTGIQVYKIAKS